jgi:sugar diacid utilization regulator
VNDLQSLIDGLASDLGRPVEVDDRRFRALAYSAHADEDVDDVRRYSIMRREAPEAVRAWLTSLGIQAASGLTRIPENRTLHMAPRVCVPIRLEDMLLGYLWLLDRPEPLPDNAVSLIENVAREIAAEVFKLQHVEFSSRDLEAGVVRSLLSSNANPQAVASAWRDAGLTSASFYTCVVVQLDTTSAGTRDGSALTRELEHLRRSAPLHSVAFAVQPARGVVMLAHDRPDEGFRRATLLADLYRDPDLEPGRLAAIGVSEPRLGLEEMAVAFGEARRAAVVGLALDSFPVVVRFRDLGAYRTILAVLDEDACDSSKWEGSLADLAQVPDGDRLLETLEAFLENGGDARATAEELFLHRSSLYNRLHRIEKLTKRDLRSGDVRLELHLALRLRRLASSPLATQVFREVGPEREDDHPHGTLLRNPVDPRADLTHATLVGRAELNTRQLDAHGTERRP